MPKALLQRCPLEFFFEPGCPHDEAALTQLKAMLNELLAKMPRRVRKGNPPMALPDKRTARGPRDSNLWQTASGLPSSTALEAGAAGAAPAPKTRKPRKRRQPDGEGPEGAPKPPAKRRADDSGTALGADGLPEHDGPRAPADAVCAARPPVRRPGAVRGAEAAIGADATFSLGSVKAEDGSLRLPVACAMRCVQSMFVELMDADADERAHSASRGAEVLMNRFGRQDVLQALEVLRTWGCLNPGGGPRSYELSDSYRTGLGVLDFPDDICQQAAEAALQLPTAAAAAGPSSSSGAGSDSVCIAADAVLTGGLLAEVSGRLAAGTLDLHPVDVQGRPVDENEDEFGANVSLGVSLGVVASAVHPPGGQDPSAQRPQPLQPDSLAVETIYPVEQVAKDGEVRAAAERGAAAGLAAQAGKEAGQAQELVTAALRELRAAGELGCAPPRLEATVATCPAVAAHLLPVLQSHGLALRVNGYDAVRVVAAEHASRYLLPGQPGAARQQLVWPWLDPVGRLNSSLWGRLLRRVLTAVVRNPGIPEPLLLHYCEAVGPADAVSLLQLLCQHKYIQRCTARVAAAPVRGAVAAFMARQVQVKEEAHYFPGPGALLSFGHVGGGRSIGLGAGADAAQAGRCLLAMLKSKPGGGQ